MASKVSKVVSCNTCQASQEYEVDKADNEKDGPADVRKAWVRAHAEETGHGVYSVNLA